MDAECDEEPETEQSCFHGCAYAIAYCAYTYSGCKVLNNARLL